MAPPQDRAHSPEYFLAALKRARCHWPAPRYAVELDDDTDRAAAHGRGKRYRLRVWVVTTGPNGGTRRKQHAQGYGPTPAMALSHCRTWQVHRRRARGQQAAL